MAKKSKTKAHKGGGKRGMKDLSPRSAKTKSVKGGGLKLW